MFFSCNGVTMYGVVCVWYKDENNETLYGYVVLRFPER